MAPRTDGLLAGVLVLGGKRRTTLGTPKLDRHGSIRDAKIKSVSAGYERPTRKQGLTALMYPSRISNARFFGMVQNTETLTAQD